ncbi:MAG: hypothetical protein NTW19_03660 [Planctomycetota bacterium]|nr:hypothetical protein [Planctomycetota bacterium]
MGLVKRWIFNLAAGASLVVCLAITILWVRSYWRSDYFGCFRPVGRGYPAEYREYLLSSDTGLLTIQDYWRRYKDPKPHPDGWPSPYWNSDEANDNLMLTSQHQRDRFELVWNREDKNPNWIRHLGEAQRFNGTTVWTAMKFPHWAAAAPFLPLPAWWVVLWRRRRRHSRRVKDGHCVGCGYDLRGTVAAGRSQCPECGVAVERPASTPA